MTCQNRTQHLNQYNAPFYAESVLEHFDTSHEVELDIVKRTTLPLE